MLEVGGVVAELGNEVAGQDGGKRARWRTRRPSSPATAADKAGTSDDSRRVRVRALEESVASLSEQVEQLRAELEESRQLNRRVAELTDIVAELIVPLAAADPDAGRAALRRYMGLPGED